MKLDDVLALHPKGADAATLRGAIEKAEALRADLLGRAADLDRQRVEGLLTLENKNILKAEADAAEARLTADRIEALLPKMRTDLHAAEGAETIEVLRGEAEQVSRLIAEQRAWLAANMPEWNGLEAEKRRVDAEMMRLRGEYTALESSAKEARDGLLTSINAAYGRQTVRDAGPITFDIPELIA